jgi:hypothetical protein
VTTGAVVDPDMSAANPSTDPGAKDPAGLSRDVRKAVALSTALGEPKCGSKRPGR